MQFMMPGAAEAGAALRFGLDRRERGADRHLLPGCDPFGIDLRAKAES
jgi:hypothetical protein